MPEDDDKVFLNDQEVDAILHYAVQFGCMLTLMQNAPDSTDKDEEIGAYRELISWLYSIMPKALIPLSHDMAGVYLDQFHKIEEAVAQFREELDESL